MQIDLSQHIESQQEVSGQPEELPDFEAILTQLNDSIASFHVGIRVLSERVNTLEKHVGYLLTQDPKVGATIQEHLAKAASDEQKP